MSPNMFPLPPVTVTILSLLLLIAILPSSLSSRPPNSTDDILKLRYDMGPVLTANVSVNLIWYGRWSPPQKRIIRSFIQSISPASHPLDYEHPLPSVSGWWRTVRLYTDQTGSNITGTVRLGEERNDQRYSHGKTLNRTTVQLLIRDAVTARKHPLPINAMGDLYLVLTSDDVHMENFCDQVCGFHNFMTFPSMVSYTMPYAWVGNSARQCPEVCANPFPSVHDKAPEKTPNGDVGVDGMVMRISHELAEMAWNPLGNAWYASTSHDPSVHSEIADMCQGVFGLILTDRRSGGGYNLNGVGGMKFLVPWIFDPIINDCYGPNAFDQ